MSVVGCVAEYIKNLLYFVREGIRPDDGCDYVIVINQVPHPLLIPVPVPIQHYKARATNCHAAKIVQSFPKWGSAGLADGIVSPS